MVGRSGKQRGLFPVSIGSWATFTTTGVPGTRFRLEPYGKCGDSPTEEQISLYRNAGWEYAFAIGASYYFLFYTTDPSAVELYSDHESRGLSLERLEKATQRAQRRTMIFYLVLIAVIAWFLFFYKSKFDVQPNNLAYLPIVLLQIFNPIFLCIYHRADIHIPKKRPRFKASQKLLQGAQRGHGSTAFCWAKQENRMGKCDVPCGNYPDSNIDFGAIFCAI